MTIPELEAALADANAAAITAAHQYNVVARNAFYEGQSAFYEAQDRVRRLERKLKAARSAQDSRP